MSASEERQRRLFLASASTSFMMSHTYTAAKPPKPPRNRSATARPHSDRAGGGAAPSRGLAPVSINRSSANEGAGGAFSPQASGVRSNHSEASRPRAQNVSATQLPRVALSANARAAQMLNLINSVSMNSATTDDQRQFQCKYLLLEDFQLYAYRHLKSLCERARHQQALRLDLAMHPSDEPTQNRREHLYDWLSRDRNRLFPPIYPGLAYNREDAARNLSIGLIDKLAGGKSSAKEKELFHLKWEFDHFPRLTYQRLEHYLDRGQTEKKDRLSDFQTMESIECILRAMQHGGEGQITINLIRATIANTATPSQKMSLHTAIASHWNVSSDVEHMLSYYDQLKISQTEKVGGGRLAAAWMKASRSIIEQVASRTATSEIKYAFGERLNESSSFQSLVLEMDDDYRANQEAKPDPELEMQKAAEIRVAVQTAEMLQVWVKEDLMDAFRDDAQVTRHVEAILRRDSATRTRGSIRDQPTSPAPSPDRRGDRRPRLV